jgi:hypothetical protein
MTLADMIRGAPKAQPEGSEPALARRDPRRQKVLDMLAREGVRYALLVADANSDPVVMTVGTAAGVREVLIHRYDAFEVLAKVRAWDVGTTTKRCPT